MEDKSDCLLSSILGGQYSVRVIVQVMLGNVSRQCDSIEDEMVPWTEKLQAIRKVRPLLCYVPEVDLLLRIRW